MAQYPQAKRDRIHYNKWRVAQKFPTSEIEKEEDDDFDEEEDFSEDIWWNIWNANMHTTFKNMKHIPKIGAQIFWP